MHTKHTKGRERDGLCWCRRSLSSIKHKHLSKLYRGTLESNQPYIERKPPLAPSTSKQQHRNTQADRPTRISSTTYSTRYSTVQYTVSAPITATHASTQAVIFWWVGSHALTLITTGRLISNRDAAHSILRSRQMGSRQISAQMGGGWMQYELVSRSRLRSK